MVHVLDKFQATSLNQIVSASRRINQSFKKVETYVMFTREDLKKNVRISFPNLEAMTELHAARAALVTAESVAHVAFEDVPVHDVRRWIVETRAHGSESYTYVYFEGNTLD